MAVRITLTALTSTDDPSCLLKPNSSGCAPLEETTNLLMEHVIRDMVPLIAYRLRSQRHPLQPQKREYFPSNVVAIQITLEYTVYAANEPRPNPVFFVVLLDRIR